MEWTLSSVDLFKVTSIDFPLGAGPMDWSSDNSSELHSAREYASPMERGELKPGFGTWRRSTREQRMKSGDN
jgi:hypothetical protein